MIKTRRALVVALLPAFGSMACSAGDSGTLGDPFGDSSVAVDSTVVDSGHVDGSVDSTITDSGTETFVTDSGVADSGHDSARDTAPDVADSAPDSSADADAAETIVDTGVDTCAPPMFVCTGSCVDVTSDPANCGSCGHACGADSSGKAMKCVASACALDCTPPQVDCGGTACVDTSTDNAHCGSCSKVCTGIERCSGGTCSSTCGSGTLDCGGSTCVDPTSNAANCGGCGHACTAGQVCVSSACCAGGTTTLCSGACVNTTNDPANCGACGTKCAPTETCSASTCIPSCAPAGSPLQVLFYEYDTGKEAPYLPSGAVTTVATAATWNAMTTADFKKYNLIVIGDGGFGSAANWNDANATKAIWGAAVTGRIAVTQLDPSAHSGVAGAGVFAKATLAWLAGGPGTNLYVSNDYGLRKYDFLSTFGSWSELGQSTDSYSGDSVHIVVPSHPTMAGSTDASLSSWSLSFHGGLTAFPPTFTSIATGTATYGDAGSTTTTIVAVREASCAACASGTITETLGTISGCKGSVTFDLRQSLCGAGFHVCSASEWMSGRGSAVPTHNYWTKDLLGYAGGPASCSVAVLPASGYTDCGASTPMRVCVAAAGPATDAEGNRCNWTNCGYTTTTPDLYFGGCGGNTTAGSLCCAGP